MKAKDEYAVKQVRGPYVKLPPHPAHCETEQELIEYCAGRRAEGAILGIDLFCGAGGLSQGLTDAGIEMVVGVDHYQYAVETHAARFPGMTVSWDMSSKESVERIGSLMKEAGIEVLAGGPPCQPFSKAGRNGIRNLIEKGLRDPEDQRRNLWRAYLEVVQIAQPRAVIMENVPDMALDSEMFIIRSMIEELEQLGYSVEERVLDAWRYGVPQFRQRLILVALRGGVEFAWPAEASKKVSVWNAIGDMPSVEGGWRPEGGAEGWIEYDGPRTDFQKYIRRNVPAEEANRLYDHITRPVREDDRVAFELMTSETKYSDLPEHLQRYRSDIFNDKYKRLDENDLSRTITAHIAKDGYGFIHPRQPRTLTVREAARLQTFPDDFRFSGPPSAAFKQIGNAVPVRLGTAVGTAVLDSLAADNRVEWSSKDTSAALAEWYRNTNERDLTQPWLRSGNRWLVLLGEIFLQRAQMTEIRMLWPLMESLPQCTKKVAPPETTIETICDVFRGPRYEVRRKKFRSVCEEISKNLSEFWAPEIDESLFPSLKPVERSTLELAGSEQTAEERSSEAVIVAKGVLRVTGRFQGYDAETRNKQSDGRLSIARMLGLNTDSRDAILGLYELARTVCTTEAPRCFDCPLQKWCEYEKAYAPATLY
ncbi:DNA (cytosine-5-)-methyltransferase [Corynebacterium sp. 32222D000AT]|uniref:DNA (cytosine-5-)-methyltransferase n=1 Tax=Corynebacterium sp. LK2522 TaxID=3110474 RepID=UPI0034CF5AD0